MVVFNQLPTRYAEGMASVAANATVVTGNGTNWTVLQPGDLFGVHKGFAVPIDQISSDGLTLTLAYPWPGPAQTNAPYCVQLVPRSVGVQEATRQLLLMLANGNLDAFAALLGSVDKVPVFTGPGTITLVDKLDFSAGAKYDKQVNTLADRATYDGSPEGFAVLVSNIGDGRAAVYSKKSNASADWSDAAIITGQDGAAGPAGPYTTINAGTVTTLAPGSQATAAFAPVSSGVVQLNLGIPAGQNGTGSGTVTSVGMTVPTGLQVSVASITTTGTFAVTYQSGYQGYTTVEANKLAGIQAGAQVNQTVGTTSGTVAAGDDSRFNNNAKLNIEDQTLTGGARITSKDLGTITTGTLTLDPGDRPLQHYTNNGAHTLAPGTNTGSFMLDITNGASAGAITVTGWTKVAGDAFTTTSGGKFRLHCSVGNGGSLLIVQALQ